MRAEGAPSSVAVARVMALGSGSCGLLRLGEPAGELDERIVAHVGFVEAGVGVLAAEIGDGHAGS